VPFALAAGLSGAISASNIVVTAGLAEIAAGSIAMGLGGYLAAKSDAEHYVSERKREQHEVKIKAEIEAQEVRDVFKEYGISEDESHAVVEGLRRDPEAWVDFMMRFELGLEKPDPKRALVSALTIAGAYIAGGFIPLSPYMIVSSVPLGLRWSVIVTLAALAVFGYVKGSFTGSHPLRAALQTVLIGGIAAAAAFGIARAIS
jgi:VIT1/CCC1 family predicted Fe2+/Mn2+ transporter